MSLELKPEGNLSSLLKEMCPLNLEILPWDCRDNNPSYVSNKHFKSENYDLTKGFNFKSENYDLTKGFNFKSERIALDKVYLRI